MLCPRARNVTSQSSNKDIHCATESMVQNAKDEGNPHAEYYTSFMYDFTNSTSEISDIYLAKMTSLTPPLLNISCSCEQCTEFLRPMPTEDPSVTHNFATAATAYNEIECTHTELVQMILGEVALRKLVADKYNPLPTSNFTAQNPLLTSFSFTPPPSLSPLPSHFPSPSPWSTHTATTASPATSPISPSPQTEGTLPCAHVNCYARIPVPQAAFANGAVRGNMLCETHNDQLRDSVEDMMMFQAGKSAYSWQRPPGWGGMTSSAGKEFDEEVV